VLDRDDIMKALDATKGDIPAAAISIGVHKATLNRWIGQSGLRDKIWRKYGRSPCASGHSRRPCTSGPTAIGRAAWYENKLGVRAHVIKAQSDEEGGEKFLSLANNDGDMVTVRFATRSELQRVVSLVSFPKRDGAGSEGEEQEIVADIQVSSATAKKRISRLISAVVAKCDAETAKNIFAAAEVTDEGR